MLLQDTHTIELKDNVKVKRRIAKKKNALIFEGWVEKKMKR